MASDAVHDLARGRATGTATCGVVTRAAGTTVQPRCAAGADRIFGSLGEVAALVCRIPACALPGR